MSTARTSLRPPIAMRLRDPEAERVRASHEEKIRELQATPCASGLVVQNIALANGALVSINHGLGRKPLWVRESCVRGATATGRIDEIRDGGHDRSQVVVLKASGYGGTVLIDLLVM